MPTRNRQLLLSSTCIAALFLAANAASAQTSLIQIRPGKTMPRGSVVLNSSSGWQTVRPASGLSQRGHMRTNYLVRIPPGGYKLSMKPNTNIPSSGYMGETPASLECVYESGLGSKDSGKGCNPYSVSATATGGELAIALVEAWNYPGAAADLSTYNTEFGLPSANFTVINQNANSSGTTCNTGGTAPASSTTGWNVEAALDIEMAHAMAPSAHIYMVQANSNSITNLNTAIQVAGTCVKNAGGGEVSMSFGVPFEFSSETNYDSQFAGTNVTYLASAGDSPGTEWPCTSPNVVCIGGTTISRDINGNFESEGVWNSDYDDVGTGGGVSLYEARPAYQNFLSSVVGSGRGVPDLAAIADPESPVWIYNSDVYGGWGLVGGTSVAAPLFAGILNRSNFIFGSSYNALANNIYPLGKSGSIAPYLTNVTQGLCGPTPYDYAIYGFSVPYPYETNPPYGPLNQQTVSGYHWNMCTGWGSPKDSGNPNWMRGPSVSR